MSTCRLCGETFTRVEGLKKHVHRGCPSLVSTTAAGVAPSVEDLTASNPESPDSLFLRNGWIYPNLKI